MELLHYVFLTPMDSPNRHPPGIFHFASEIQMMISEGQTTPDSDFENFSSKIKPLFRV